MKILRQFPKNSDGASSWQTLAFILLTISLPFGLGFVLSTIGASSVQVRPADNGMVVPRHGHTATLLADGKVLIVGGVAAAGFARQVEIYNPATRQFSPVGDPVNPTALTMPRRRHTATLIDGDRVLIAGGLDERDAPLSSIEIFDTTTGTFTTPDLLSVERVGHTATLLPDGRVLFAGGDGQGTAEIYDPASPLNHPLHALAEARFDHTATLFSDASVLLSAGGAATAEFFDTTQPGNSPASFSLQYSRAGHAAVIGLDHNVYLIGGLDPGNVEKFSVLEGQVGLVMSLPAAYSTGIGLANGSAFTIGPAGASVLNLSSGTTTQTFTEDTLQRSGATATDLGADRKILITGGANAANEPIASAAVFNPAKISTDYDDYPPGSPVGIYGSGYLPGETVRWQVVHVIENGDNDTSGVHAPRETTADANGNFFAIWDIPSDEDELGATLEVTATGQSSMLSAQARFTDAFPCVPTSPASQVIPYTQDFGGLTHNSATYPAGWQGWKVGTAASSSFSSSFPPNPPTTSCDETLNANSSASTTTGGVHNYDGKIGILASGGTDPALTLVIDTTGRSAIKVKFDIMTVRNHQTATDTRQNGVDVQFRVGTSAAFVSVSGLVNGIYQNLTGTANDKVGSADTTGQNIQSVTVTLPRDADNHSVVQIRWVQRDVSGAGDRPSFAVDNVCVTGTATSLGFQGFEPLGDSWAFASSGGAASNATGSTDSPANQRILSGSQSWQVNNAASTLTFDPVNTAGYSSVSVRVRASSTSGTSGNGADGGDQAKIFVALNGGAFPATPDITVSGNNNAKWGYDGTGTVQTPAGTPASVAPGGGGTRTTDGYSTLIVTVPDGTTSVALKIVANNNATDEFWNFDNISLAGTLNVTGTITGSQTICGGSSANLSVALTGQAPWSLTVFDGTSSTSYNSISSSPLTFAVTPATTTTYTVTAVSQSDCAGTITGIGVGSATVTVDTNSACSITPTDAAPLCPNSTGHSYSAPEGMDNYSWSITPGGNGSIVGLASEQTVSVSAGAACGASFTLNLTITKNGCSSTCSQSVLVEDSEFPTVTSCPTNAVIECPATPGFGEPIFADNCDTSLTMAFNDVTVPGNCAGNVVATVTRTWTATDDCGHSVQCSQTITVKDTTAPAVVSCPEEATVDCPATPVFGLPVFHDACDADLTITSGEETLPGDCAIGGKISYRVKRTWTATDDCGNTVICSQTISVRDETPPVITCAPDATIECPATPLFLLPTTSDLCATVSLSSIDETLPGDCASGGTIKYGVKRTWTATDGCGNSSSCSQTITVRDTTPPTVTAGSVTFCQPSEVIALAAALATTTASDNCTPSGSLNKSASRTGLDCQATITVTVTDECGNSASKAYSVRFDVSGPSLTCPSDFSVECAAAVPAPAANVAEFQAQGGIISDPCTSGTSLRLVSSDSVSGSCPTTITRTYTVTDGCGNSSTCTQTITINDTTPPVMTCPAEKELQCGESTDPSDTGTATAIDNCDAAPLMTAQKVWLNEIHYDNAGADKGEFIEIAGVAGTDLSNYSIQLYNGADGQFYASHTFPAGTILPNEGCGYGAIAVFQTDPSGTATGEFRNPSGTPYAGGIQNGPDGFTITLTLPGGQTLVQLLSYGGSFAATDGPAAGLPSTDIGVQESSSSTAVGYSLQLRGTGNKYSQFGWSSPQPASPGALNAGQNIAPCLPPVTTITFIDAAAPPGCAGQAGIDRTWTATDGCGQSSTCVQHIRFIDQTVPTVTAGMIAACYPTAAAAEAAAVAATTASDNCPGTLTRTASTAGDCDATVTVTVTDGCGNRDSVSYSTRIDNTAPTVTAGMIAACYPTAAAAEAAAVAATTASDNCPGTLTRTASTAGDCDATVTVTVTDGCGNRDSVSYSTRIDNTAPTVTAGMIAACYPTAAAAEAAAVAATTASDNCPGTLTRTASTAGDCDASVTVTVTDGCGNRDSVSYSTRIDNTAPTVTAGMIAACYPTAAAAEAAAVAATTASDNCPGTLTRTASTAGDCDATVTVTVTDGCGNRDSVSYSTRIDNTAPTVTAGMIAACYPTAAAAEAAAVAATTASDNCPGTLTRTASTAGDCDATVTVTVTDGCGNRDSVSYSTRIDNTAPTVTAGMIAACYPTAAAAEAAAVAATTASDNCPGTLTRTASTAGDCDATVTVTVTDGCGNRDSVSYSTRIDNTAPTVTAGMIAACYPTAAAAEAAAAAATTASDNCPGTLTRTASTAGDCDATVTVTVTDGCGNRDSVSYSTRIDNTAPTVTAGMIAACYPTAAAAEAAAVAATTASDNCPGTLTRTASTAGDCDATVTVTVTDGCGNRDSVSYSTRIDNTAPTVTAGMIAACYPTAAAAEAAAVAATTASDNCPGTLTRTASTAGDCDATVTVTVTDGCGNRDSVSYSTRIDGTKPVLTGCPDDLTVQCLTDMPPTATVSASDTCDGTLTPIFSETRSGPDCDQTIVRTWTVTDTCGNVRSCSQTIHVKDTTKPTATLGAIAACYLTVADANAAALAATSGLDDNCAPLNAGNTVTKTVQTSAAVGCSTSVVIRVEDACGNYTDYTYPVRVDNTPPLLICPAADLVIECGDPDRATKIADWLATASTTDNCGSTTVGNNYSAASFTDGCGNSGEQTVTFIAVDACGTSSATCTRKVIIRDTTAPTVSCPPGISLQCPDATPAALATLAAFLAGGGSASDGCGGPLTLSLFSELTAGTCPQTITRTYRVTDACGNSTDCTQIITKLSPNQPPTLKVTRDGDGPRGDDHKGNNGSLDVLGVNEGSTLKIQLVGTDPDAGQSLTYSIQGVVPSGMTINPSNGKVNWTPTETQGPGNYEATFRVTDDGPGKLFDEKKVTLKVKEVNQAPTLNSPGNKNVTAQSNLSFTLTATDPDLPANALAFSIQTGFKTGMVLNPGTGQFSWTPAASQGPATYSVTFQVKDGGGLSNLKTISIKVTVANHPPNLTNPGTKTIKRGNTLTVVLNATDADQPANTLIYSITGGFKPGMSITGNTFKWVVPSGQVKATYSVTVKVTDNAMATDTETFFIKVE